jgi:hypothetical protein
VPVFAETPIVEMFAGYSYFRLPMESDGVDGGEPDRLERQYQTECAMRVGVIVDFGGNYGERRMLPTQFQPRETHPGDYRQHTVLVGPEVRAYANDRISLNVRALIGGTAVDTLVLPLREPFQPGPDSSGGVQPPVTAFRMGGEKPVTGAFGGSVDYRISDRLAYRILQPDLVVTHLGGVVNRMNFRVSTGIVFRFGSR